MSGPQVYRNLVQQPRKETDPEPFQLCKTWISLACFSMILLNWKEWKKRDFFYSSNVHLHPSCFLPHLTINIVYWSCFSYVVFFFFLFITICDNISREWMGETFQQISSILLYPHSRQAASSCHVSAPSRHSPRHRIRHHHQENQTSPVLAHDPATETIVLPLTASLHDFTNLQLLWLSLCAARRTMRRIYENASPVLFT